MKRYFLLATSLCFAIGLIAQNTKQLYPVPEYSNEIYFLKKDSAKLLRLEKGFAKMETKSKMMGMGGMDHGYVIDDQKSPVRLRGGSNLLFLFYTGEQTPTSPEADSAMKAGGMDPSVMSNSMSMIMDPGQTTSLYNMKTEKGKRKISLMSAGGMGIGKGKKQSTKYTLSIKKVKAGYYEMLVDKTLPKGEYAFVIMSLTSMDGSYMLYAFGVD